MFIYKFIKYLILNIRYQRILNRIYAQEELIAKMSYMFGTQVEEDRIGRLYCVINPLVRDGKFHPDQIYELDYNEGKITNEIIEKWIMEKLIILKNFISDNNLFELLTYHIEELEGNNFLVILEPITISPLLRSIKWMILEILILITMITIFFYIWKF